LSGGGSTGGATGGGAGTGGAGGASNHGGVNATGACHCTAAGTNPAGAVQVLSLGALTLVSAVRRRRRRAT
jgi:hypothetical protein